MRNLKIFKKKIAIAVVASGLLFGAYSITEKVGYANTISGSNMYMGEDLNLTFAQARIDWFEGMDYDEKKYELQLIDNSEVLVNTEPGEYYAEYRLMPLDAIIEESVEEIVTERDDLIESGENFSETVGLSMDGDEESEDENQEYFEVEFIEDPVTQLNENEDDSKAIYFYRKVIVECPYEAEELNVKIGDQYTLYDDITYDDTIYTLELLNESDFNRNISGGYLMNYSLTRLDGRRLWFTRYVVLHEADKESDSGLSIMVNDEVAAITTQLPSTGVISYSGSYSKYISGTTTSRIIVSANVKNVTLYLAGSGTIGGITLPESLESLTIWMEEGSNVVMTAAITTTSSAVAAIAGGTNARIFILGDGKLTLNGAAGYASQIVEAHTTAMMQNGVPLYGGTAGYGGSAAIGTSKSVSIYSTNNNIIMTGGNGGAASRGGYAYLYRWTTTAWRGTAGAGGGGGGYPALAIGANGTNGNAGSDGPMNWYVFYNNYGVSPNYPGQNGGSGSLGGGGGSGASAAYTSSGLTSGQYVIYGSPGAAGTLTQSTGAVSRGGTGGTGSNLSNSVVGSAGGTGGTSTAYTAYGYNAVMPIYYHYNGTDLAQATGNSGTWPTATTDITRVAAGKGSIFYGFSANATNIANAPTNVQDVMGTTNGLLGVSYNPAPVIDLEYFYTDETFTTTLPMWNNPDIEGRGVGYELPEGATIIGYNVTTYTDAYMNTVHWSDYFTVAQVDSDGNGVCVLPDSFKDEVSYWEVDLVIRLSDGTELTSPSTVAYTGGPLITVIDESEREVSFVTLRSALTYIKDHDQVGTAEDLSEYRLIYLRDHNHDTVVSAVNTDSVPLEAFSKANTHLIFESLYKTDGVTGHTNRYAISAASFSLPKDKSDTSVDDNMKVTFRDINITATTVYTNGTDFTIDNESSVATVSVLTASDTTDTGISMKDSVVEIQKDQSLTTLNMTGVDGSPDLILGMEEEEKSFALTSILGGQNVKMVNLTALSTTTLQAYNELVVEGDTRITIPGNSTVNEIGDFYAVDREMMFYFSNTFASSTQAPLHISGDVYVGEGNVNIDIANAQNMDDSWLGKDIISFTTLDKINIGEYYSSRIKLGIDPDTIAVEVYEYRDMRVQVTFPNSTSIKFPTYADAVDWIMNTYTGTAAGNYTITLIDDYPFLGAGGSGMNSTDNKALRSLYKASGVFIFTSNIKDTETGERYQFVESYVDDYGNTISNGYNDTFCLPENTARGTATARFITIDLGFIEHVYAGNILLQLYSTVTSDKPITYYGTYDMSEASGTNQSRMAIIASNDVGLDADGEIQGISVIGFASLYNYASSKLYLNEVKKADQYATIFYRYQNAEVHYQQGGAYEWGTITHYSTGIKSYFNHKEAIVHSYGGGLTHTTATWYNYIYFDDPINSINRDLYVFFTLDGTPTSSYAKIASHSLSADVTNMVTLVANDNIIRTQTYIAVVSPEDETDSGLDTVNYYKTLTLASNAIIADSRIGEFEIVFLDDYTMSVNDLNALYVVNRDGIELKISSKYREELAIQNNAYSEPEDDTESLGVISRMWSNIVEFFSSDEDEVEEVDEYAGYAKVTMYNNGTYEFISMPRLNAVPVLVDEIVFDMALPTTRSALVLGGSGILTMGEDVRIAQGVLNLGGYTTTNAALTNHDPQLVILGGEYNNVYGAWTTSTVTTTGVVPKVHVYGATIKNLYGGSSGTTNTTTFLRSTEIHLYEGAVVTDLITVSNAFSVFNTARYGELFIHADMELPKIRNFDRINIGDGVTVKMNGVLDAYYHATNFATNTIKAGILQFGQDSQLQLYEVPSGTTANSDGINSIGKIVTTGTGASLVVPKMGNGIECLRVDVALASSVTDTTAGALTIVPAEGFEYKAPTYVQNEEGDWVVDDSVEDEDEKNRFASGDNIIYFSSGKSNGSNIVSYNNGFFPLGMIGNGTTGYISLGAMPITMAKNDGQHTYYTSIAAACDEIGRDGDDAGEIDYTIIVREEGYTISTADSTGMSTYGKNANSITLTSAFILTEQDTLVAGEKVGDSARRIINISGSLTCYTDMYFDNILVNITVANANIYANGFELYMGTNKAPYLPSDVAQGNLEIVGIYFPNVYGGNATTGVSVNSTHVELGSGTYTNVYGGSYLGRVTNDTYIQIGNSHTSGNYAVDNVTINGNIYGGGQSNANTNLLGYVYGNTNVIVYGASFTQAEQWIIGGGATSTTGTSTTHSRVGKDVHIEIWDAYAPNSNMTVAGAYNANVVGSVYIEVAEGGASPVAQSAAIYGTLSTNGSLGTIGGNMEVRVHSGEGLTLIKEAKNFTTKRVTGEINIYMGTGGPGGGIGGVNALQLDLETIDQFTNLYIGYNEEEVDDEEIAAVGYASGAAHVTIGTSLIGNPYATTITQRNGTIHMMEGSSLTLPTSGTVKASNLQVDETLPHLYIGKENKDTATNPLVLNGNNLSGNIFDEEDEDASELLNRLIIGLQSHEHNSLEEGELAEVGDNLIQFTTTANARDYDYVSGVDKFEIVVSPTEAGIIEYGASSLPIITQTLIEHKDADGNITEPATGMNASINSNLGSNLNTVTKTLYFTFENEDEDGDYSGYEIDTAYIANTGVKNTVWGEGGVMPTGVTEIEITTTDTEGLWQGKVTLDIESYGIGQKPYYAHVRDERNSVKVILLDVHSPIYTTEPVVQQVDGGDYHITLAMTDPTYQEMAGTDGVVHPYNAAGIYQGAYTIGTALECPGEDEILENRQMTVSENVKDVIDAHSNSTTFSGTAVVPKELLEDADMSDTVIYMYLKDNLGNTRRVAIPMSEYMIDVTIPTRVGMVALADTDNYLLAPQCFVVNNGNNKVMAEIVGADIGVNNPVEFVTGSENLGKDKMWLVISSDYRPYEYMHPFSYISVEYLPTMDLYIGNMSSASDGQNAAYYTFQAIYNAGDLVKTGDWSLFTMKYRFTVLADNN